MDSRVRRFEVQTYPIRHALSSMGSNVNLKKKKKGDKIVVVVESCEWRMRHRT